MLDSEFLPLRWILQILHVPKHLIPWELWYHSPRGSYSTIRNANPRTHTNDIPGQSIRIPYCQCVSLQVWGAQPGASIKARFPNNSILKRVPCFLIFGFKHETPKLQGKKGTTGVPRQSPRRRDIQGPSSLHRTLGSRPDSCLGFRP